MSNFKEQIKAAQIDLIKELGIDKLEKEKQEKMVIEIGEILQQKIATRVSEELPEDKIEEFKTILERASEEPGLVDSFLEENVPDFQDLVLEEIGEYKKNALNFVNRAIDNGKDVEDEDQEKEEKMEEDEKEKQEEEEKEETENLSTDEEEADLKIEIEPTEDQAEIKPESNSEVEEEAKLNLNNTSDLDFEENKEPADSLNLEMDLDEKAEELGRENALKTEGEEAGEVLEKETPDYREALNLKESPIEIKKPQENDETEENEVSDENENSNLSQLEEEQIEDEAKILEENRVDNAVIQSEELDLSNELEKMEDGGDDAKK